MNWREYLKIATQLDPNKYGTAYGLTALLPVLAGHEDALEAELDGLDPLASPFAAVADLHFARLLVIRDLVYQGPPQRPESLDCAYLIFTTSSDGELEPLLREVAGLPAARAIFGHCDGFVADPDGFAAWVSSHRKDNGYFLTPWPFTRVGEIKEALRVQDGFGSLVERADSLDDAALQRAFSELMR
jgi:hypothetical protein